MLDLNNFGAVIFDMDGLVLDTETTYFRAWQQAAGAMGYVLTDAFCQTLSGLHYKDVEQQLIRHCGGNLNLTRFNQLSGQYWREFVQLYGIKTQPGFVEFIKLVKQQRLPYGLATNSRTKNTVECLALAGLTDVFTVIVTRDDVELGKPDPAIFLQAAAWLQVDISECLILEDSLAGITAASRAGAFAVYIPSTSMPNQQAADSFAI